MRAADSGSFSAAARDIASSQSAVTRQIGQLEGHFGVRLFHRSTRRLALTGEGQLLRERALQLLDEAGQISDLLTSHRDRPVGVVRFAVPGVIAHYLAPRLPRLFERHPGLSVHLDIGDRRHDLIAEGIDVALRAGEVDDSTLIGRRIGGDRLILVAAPNYLDFAGVPVRPADLNNLACLGYRRDETVLDWHLVGPDGATDISPKGPLTTNNFESLIDIVQGGYGVALLPIFRVIDHIRQGRLVRVLPDHSTLEVPLHLIYPSRRNLPSRTRVFMEFVAGQMGTDLSFLMR